jgi:hypothetical protein
LLAERARQGTPPTATFMGIETKNNLPGLMI